MAKTVKVIGDGDLSDAPDFIRELLEGIGVNKGGKPKMSNEEAVVLLRATASRYAKGNHFKVGDIVTPREGFNMKKVGEPHIVIEKLDDPNWTFNVESNGTAAYGRRLDMRVMCVMDGDVTCFWAESWSYEFHPLNNKE